MIELFCNTLSEHFKHPYSQTIPNNNLDLNTVKKKLEDNKYDSEEPFIREIRQIFNNYKKRNNVCINELYFVKDLPLINIMSNLLTDRT